MKNILITGSKGFIGKNLIAYLNEQKKYNIFQFDTDNNYDELENYIKECDFVFHLAGVNRPKNVSEFYEGNCGFTEKLIELLQQYSRSIPILVTSSIQVELDNDYGKSKLKAEDAIINYSKDNNVPVRIYRLPNVFGKWCRPNYNSAIATFCYNISHDLDVYISDESKKLKLVYIDDVIQEFVEELENENLSSDNYYSSINKTYEKSLSEIVDAIRSFRNIRNTSIIPDMNDDFIKVLHTTYLSYLEEDNFAYSLEKKEDNRGWLAELVKSHQFGQMFVSKTNPGIARGNHYHHTKVEKFIVIQGTGLIRFRKVDCDKVIQYTVNGTNPEVVDIPPGYTHSIENIGKDELITLFWANEIFNNDKPDTFYCEV